MAVSVHVEFSNRTAQTCIVWDVCKTG